MFWPNWVNWLALAALLAGIAAGAARRRCSGSARAVADAVFVTALCGLALYVAGWVLGLGFLWYLPVLFLCPDGWPLTTGVIGQAVLTVAAAAAAAWRNPASGLPLLVFTIAVAGFGAWMALNPDEWLPTPS